MYGGNLEFSPEQQYQPEEYLPEEYGQQPVYQQDQYDDFYPEQHYHYASVPEYDIQSSFGQEYGDINQEYGFNLSDNPNCQPPVFPRPSTNGNFANDLCSRCRCQNGAVDHFPKEDCLSSQNNVNSSGVTHDILNRITALENTIKNDQTNNKRMKLIDEKVSSCGYDNAALSDENLTEQLFEKISRINKMIKRNSAKIDQQERDQLGIKAKLDKITSLTQQFDLNNRALLKLSSSALSDANERKFANASFPLTDGFKESGYYPPLLKKQPNYRNHKRIPNPFDTNPFSSDFDSANSYDKQPYFGYVKNENKCC